jgi:hypothetical protein
MSLQRQLSKILTKLIRRFLANTKKQLIWLLRTIFGTQKQQKVATAGFVLPTVAMVSVVVVLLTTAIMVRSFNRAQNASNIRINETVLSAAIPAIDRSRAKINKLFEDISLPKVTPTDEELYKVLDDINNIDNINKYTFADETKLQISFDINGNGAIEQPTTSTSLSDQETLNTVWRFPVDTDNNGKFDSYTLYSILLRTPRNIGGKYARNRTPLETRSSPMTKGILNPNCTTNADAILVGNTGWIKQNHELNKSFFVYTATVPITTTPSDTTNYEKHQGNQGFASLEYQQDRSQRPPSKVAVYNDDLEINPDTDLNLNGGIFTNSNFLTGGSGQVQLYQISSKASCYYKSQNSKIIVGGNLGSGGFKGAGTTATKVDLFKGKNTNPTASTWEASVTEDSPNLMYNNLAYVNRINQLIASQFANAISSDPSEVKKGIEKRKQDLGLSSFTTAEFDAIRRQQLQLYFQKRTRRVPYQEVNFGDVETFPSTVIQGSDDTLRPIDKWMYAADPSDGKTGTDYSTLTLNTTGASLQPQATEPQALQDASGVEAMLGDRILVSHNLSEIWWNTTPAASSENNVPEQWWNESNQPTGFVGTSINDRQEISGIKWNAGNTSKTRTRQSLVQTATLADLADTSRDGAWELDAAKIPQNITEPVGGLRVVTGAGVYLSATDTTTTVNSTVKEIWPDTMPIPGTAPATKTITPYSLYDPSIAYQWREIADASTPYLQMRATAIYHYKAQTPTPIACVSSFYVPSNSTTAKNITGLPWNAATDGLSNNGIVYPAPTSAKGESHYATVLNYLSQLTYPNGRLIDDGLLAKALAKTANRTISEQSAIDAQICALQILDGSISPSDTVIPHGAIYETSLLDSREIARNSSSNNTTYDYPIIDRQPLEIRATVLDLNQLRTNTIGTSSPSQEYLLPNSGIIYATRDDALPDASAGTAGVQTDAQKLVSPVDYILDSTRRPNAIMLINGSKLGRGTGNAYREAEKGLILASNLPVYVKGNFNLHTQGEFTDVATTAFYDRTTANADFGCRNGDPTASCATGDEWRPATVLGDAVTLLSDNFREGFRDEGDYDWNNSLVGTPPSGFSAVNFFGANGKWADTSTSNAGFPQDFDPATTGYQGSSYVNNLVTPLVRMVPAREYAYEICTSTVQDECFCSATDTADECAIKTRRWSMTNVALNGYNFNGQNSWREDGIGSAINSIKTGFIGTNPDNGWEALPFKRLALKRDIDTTLPITPLTFYGKGSSNKLEEFPIGGATLANLVSPTMLIPWLLPNSSGVFEPVLQIQKPFATETDPDNTTVISSTNDTKNWLQPVLADTTFNLIVAAGDSPARPITEDNGGLQNLTRFMENWASANGQKTANIFGSFMQIKKSAYATGTYNVNVEAGSIVYPIANDSGATTGYLPPTRNWGYDVALLSQSPDRFASKLVLTSPDLPDEYFREVNKDDQWVQTLLCAKTTGLGISYAIDKNQRPSTCQ